MLDYCYDICTMPVYERVTAFGFSPDGRTTFRYFLVGDTAKSVIVILPGYTGEHADYLN